MRSLGPSLPLSPPSCLRRGWASLQPGSSSLDLLRPFVLRTAGSMFGRLIFSRSFAVPQFKLVTHKSSLQLSSGHSGPVLTVSNAAHSSPFHPTCWWRMRASGVLCCWELLLGTQSVGFIYLFIYLFSYR